MAKSVRKRKAPTPAVAAPSPPAAPPPPLFPDQFDDSRDSLFGYVDGLRPLLGASFNKLGYRRSPIYYDGDTPRTWVAAVLVCLRDVTVDKWRLTRANGEGASAAFYRGWCIRVALDYLVEHEDEREALEGLMRMQVSRTLEERENALHHFRRYFFEMVARAAGIPWEQLALVDALAGNPGQDNFE